MATKSYVCSIIVLLLLIQSLQIQAQRIWQPHFDYAPVSPVENRMNSFVKYLLMNKNKEVTTSELLELLKLLKITIAAKKERAPEFWLLREG